MGRDGSDVLWLRLPSASSMLDSLVLLVVVEHDIDNTRREVRKVMVEVKTREINAKSTHFIY